MRPARPERKNPAKLQRALFTAEDLHEPVSVWVALAEAEHGYTVTLQHDYEDFAPAVGCDVEVAGLHLTVTGVEGRVLTCVKEN